MNEKLEKLVETKNRHEIVSTPEMAAVAKIESELYEGARDYFRKAGFTRISTPHITNITGSCENVNTLIMTYFFGKKAPLVQTGQLYLELFVPTIGKVYCDGPSFRGEPEADPRHLAEFPLLEIEFPGDLDELLGHIENTIISMVDSVLKYAKPELELLDIDYSHLENIKKPFKRITYTEALESLEKKHALKWADDFDSKLESELMQMHGNQPMFITHYPEKIKFFNMRTNADNQYLVNSADLLLPPGGEAVGAAEREYEHFNVKRKLVDSKMFKDLVEIERITNPAIQRDEELNKRVLKNFDWYLGHLEKQGSIPHAGCGIGLNRVTQYVLGSEDIRTTTPFPVNKESLM